MSYNTPARTSTDTASVSITPLKQRLLASIKAYVETFKAAPTMEKGGLGSLNTALKRSVQYDKTSKVTAPKAS